MTRRSFLSVLGNEVWRVEDFATACGSCCSFMESQAPGLRRLHRLYAATSIVSRASQSFHTCCQRRNEPLHGNG